MLEKKYNHKEVEKGKYNQWLKNGYFESGDLSKKPYCIVIPPPNVTGNLHLGHAWDTTLQDIMIRYKRMDGYDALWLPGMDHAGIATQARVDARLRKMGVNPRGIERDEWLKHAWDWKDEYAKNIRNQWSVLGLSLDYTKERFTLDEGLSQAVNHVFVKLYEKGLIYRGERIINWDPAQMTALSNEEVIYKDIKGALYYIKYWLEDKSGFLEVATTRPETLFGDTAVAVNPNDVRYKKYVGKNVILPIANKTIPIIADEYVDMEYGTGVVKITPAHDPNDFEVGERHDLERIVAINPNGTMNGKAKHYNKMDRFLCRKELVKELEEKDLLIKIEEIIHSVGHSERSDAIVEPFLSKQWFVKMRPLADRVLENQKNKNKKVDFVPERFEKILTHWMEITHDWCISRQLWWGHRIPAWYKGDDIYVGYDAPHEEGWVQDSDVLDTWFSSALWSFSTLGWPNDTEMLNRYYPNNLLVTGYDIIPFWVCRMIFQGLEFLDERPFKDCLIHGLIRDKEGRKMSKSLDNGVDPMDVIDSYGADALRFFLTTTTAPGQDLRYDEEKVKATWNFINKLWNASRFVMINLENFKNETVNIELLTDSDKWILSKQNEVIKKVRHHMEKYEFNVVGQELYNFIWNDFCDWYIELSKINMNEQTKSVLLLVLKNILKLLHPFMPYVTEEIYLKLPIEDKTIMLSEYPKYDEKYDFFEEVNNIDNIIQIITKIRTVKNEKSISKGFIIINKLKNEFKFLINDNKNIFEKMLKCFIDEDINDNMQSFVIVLSFGKVIVYWESQEEVYDFEQMQLEREKLLSSIKRREKLLSNKGYINNAPKKIVDEEQKKFEEEKAKLITIDKIVNDK